jgi:ABC-type branched-subunit amino acid transport system substrate-binding protein
MRSRSIRTGYAVAALAVSLALTLSACSSSKKSTTTGGSSGASGSSSSPTFNGEIKIGAAVGLTGSAGSDQVQLSEQYAADQINAKGGVMGKKIVLDVQDIGNTAATGLAAARTFVQDKVDFVAGYSLTTQNLAVSPVLQAAKIVSLLGTASTANNFDQTKNPYNFIFNIPDNETAVHQVTFATQTLKAKKFALLLDSSAFGQGYGTLVTPLINAAGGSVVSSQAVNPDANDLSTQISKILSAKPDVVLVALLTVPTAVLMYSELKKQVTGTPPALIVAATVVPQFGKGIPWATGAGTYATYMTAGMYDPSALSPDSKGWFDAVGLNSSAKVAPSDSSAEAHDMILGLAAAITATGGTDPDKISAYLATLKNFSSFNGVKTVSGPYTCDATTHQCLHAQYLGQVQGEAIKQILHYDN